jgi:acetylglutamate kinase
MVDPRCRHVADIVLMRSVRLRPVVVHGGGQISELMERLGKVPERDGTASPTPRQSTSRAWCRGQGEPRIVAHQHARPSPWA